MEEDEESYYPCVECEFPRKSLLIRGKLIPTLKIRFERFEQNELDSATMGEEQELDRRSTVDTMSV